MKNIFTIVFLSLGLINASCADDNNFGTRQSLDNVAPGTFVSVGNKNVKGTLIIEERGDELFLILNSDFKTQSGPDLRVVLREGTNHDSMLTISDLLAFDGEQEYKIPLTKEALEVFDHIVIYCAQAHVDFGIASLK